MAVQTEMYTPVGASIVMQQPVRQAAGFVSWWDLLVNAARSRFGSDMRMTNPSAVQVALTRFIEDLLFTVVHNDPEPLMERPTIIDVTFKEFVNLGERESDETTFRLGKNLPIAAGSRYVFSMMEGVQFDHKYNFGAQIVGLSMAGGYMSVGSMFTVKEQSYNQGVQFVYNHKEKITVPPKTKVKAKITTSTRKYRQNYTLEFSAPRTSYISIEYFSGVQDDCLQSIVCCKSCQTMPTVGCLYITDIIRTLPNFKVSDNGYCSFTQNGTLSWIGEAYTVEKSEAPIN